MVKIAAALLVILVLLSGCALPDGSGAKVIEVSSPAEQVAEKAQDVPSGTSPTAQLVRQSADGDEVDEPAPAARVLQQGEQVTLVDGVVSLDASAFTPNSVHYYNTALPSGKTVYFFVARDQNGTHRAAANACQVCFASRLGFRHEGDLVICNTCGNRYPLAKVATEKGGCNPAPINPNLEARNGKLGIAQAALEQIAELF